MTSNCSFLCKIADLITEIPTAGGLAPRCAEYMCNEYSCPDIVIRSDKYRKDKYPVDFSEDMVCYLESGIQFYSNLLKYCGFYLHSSAVAMEGRVYLFSGPCGVGKSTHSRVWQQTFGDTAQVINDDKPALRRIDGLWYAYGTPWCGKDGINKNEKVPLGGICFLKQANENKIRRLGGLEATQKILTQTFNKFRRVERLDEMLSLIDMLVQEIPVYELENRPEPAAAILSYETMRSGAEEFGL